MFHTRRQHGDKQALIPALIGLAGVLAQFILLGKSPQPLALAGWVGLAVGAVAWAVYLLTRRLGRKRSNE
jgi:hypothetical protein